MHMDAAAWPWNADRTFLWQPLFLFSSSCKNRRRPPRSSSLRFPKPPLLPPVTRWLFFSLFPPLPNDGHYSIFPPPPTTTTFGSHFFWGGGESNDNKTVKGRLRKGIREGVVSVTQHTTTDVPFPQERQKHLEKQKKKDLAHFPGQQFCFPLKLNRNTRHFFNVIVFISISYIKNDNCFPTQ